MINEKGNKPYGFSYYNFFPKNNKGLSGVVAAVIMIALVMMITTIIWVVINNLIKEKISTSESCFGNFGKVTLGREYTCYDFSSDEVRFFINIGDINVD